MLKDRDATPSIAVKNIDTARNFYENTLGLTSIVNEGEDLIVFKSGDTKVAIYRSQFAGTNKATILTWSVGEDIEDTVRTLKSKGVAFEHYDMPNIKLEGDVHVTGSFKVAWFKDPDGNILSLINQ